MEQNCVCLYKSELLMKWADRSVQARSCELCDPWNCLAQHYHCHSHRFATQAVLSLGLCIVSKCRALLKEISTAGHSRTPMLVWLFMQTCHTHTPQDLQPVLQQYDM